MAKKNKNGARVDNKNRRLFEGESQRPDGRYRYRYTVNGKTYDVYSWRLNQSDRLPQGKHPCKSLREMELEIKKELAEGRNPHDGTMTVTQLCEEYLSTRRKTVRPNTLAGYNTSLKAIKTGPIGNMAINSVTQNDIKQWFIKMNDNGKGYSTIHNIRGVLRPAFVHGIKSNYITYNPADFVLSDVVINDAIRREAITPEQERRFLDFIRQDKHFGQYYDAFFILFHTGMRIGEFCGLTVDDIDMEAGTIRIVRQLQRRSDGTLYTVPPKSKAGIRIIPMMPGVKDAFEHVLKNRVEPKSKDAIITVDGISGFLFFTEWNGVVNLDGKAKGRKVTAYRPTVGMDWEHRFAHVVEKYNKTYNATLALPKITPHIARHTFISRMANQHYNPITLAAYVGHTGADITINVYTTTTTDDMVAEMKRVQNSEMA